MHNIYICEIKICDYTLIMPNTIVRFFGKSLTVLTGLFFIFQSSRTSKPLHQISEMIVIDQRESTFSSDNFVLKSFCEFTEII